MGLLVLPYGVQGCKYVCGGPLEDLRIPFWPFLFCFSFISWNCLVSFLHVIKLCLLSQNSKFPSFFPFFSCLNHFSPVLCPIFFFHKHLSCFGLCGLSPKGGIGVLAYIQPTPFSTSTPIHHHADTFHFHLLLCAAFGSIPVQGSFLTNL